MYGVEETNTLLESCTQNSMRNMH